MGRDHVEDQGCRALDFWAVRFDLPHMTAFDQRALAKICRDVLEETAKGKVPPTSSRQVDARSCDK